MPYTRPYASGFVDYPSTTTPINSTALNTMDVGIKTANDQFQTVTTAQRAALSPTVGQAVWDSDLKQLMVYVNASGGNAWQPVGNTIVCTSTTRPATPFHGQVIYETDTKKEYRYNGTTWVQTNSASTTSGVTGVSNLIVPPAARILLTADVALASASWTTFAGFTSTNASVDYDTDSMVALSGTASNMTVNTSGIYVVSATCIFASNITGNRGFRIYRDRSGTLTSIANVFLNGNANTGALPMNLSGIASFQANDKIVYSLYQSSGGSLNLQYRDTDVQYAQSQISATWIGRTS